MQGIRKMRERAGLTQEKVAERMEVKQSTVAAWEAGRYLPEANKLPKLAEVLGCSIDELYRKEND